MFMHDILGCSRKCFPNSQHETIAVTLYVCVFSICYLNLFDLSRISRSLDVLTKNI